MKQILSHKLVINAIAFGLILLTWQIIYLTADEPLVFPSIKTIAITGYHMIQTKLLWTTYFNTLVMLSVGWIISIFCIIVAVSLCWAFPLFRKIFECYCSYFNSLPNFVLIPFLVLLLGLTKNVIIVIMVFSVFFIMSHQILSEFDNIKITWGKHVTNLRWNSINSLIRVYLPASAPVVLSMCNMTWAYMWRGLISLEVVFGNIGGYFGLGTYLIDVKNTMDIDKMYVVLFVIAVTGYAINNLLERIANYYKW